MAGLKDANTLGTYLNELLTTKKIDKKYLSMSLDINRTQLYRFLNGEQLPDIELIHKIAVKLNLRASEYDKLLESYECSAFGVEVIKGRKIVFDIIDRMIHQNNEEHLGLSYSSESLSLFPANEDCRDTQIIPIQGKNRVHHAIYTLLNSVKESGTKIRLLMQPDQEGLENLLPSLLKYISDHKVKSSIAHIIRFKDIALDRNKLYNLNLLDKLLPYSGCDDIYNVFYTIGNYDTLTYDNFFPNIICLGNQRALTISADFQNALFINNYAADIVSLMCSEFDKILKDCLPMYTKVSDVFEMSKHMLEYEAPAKTDTYLLHPEHIFYTFPITLIEEKAKEYKVPGSITTLLLKRVDAFRKRLKKNQAYEVITAAGLDQFVQTGILLIQGGLYFSINQRIEILENLVEFVENNRNYNLSILRENHPYADLDSAVYIIDEELLYIVPSYSKLNTAGSIFIRERGIIESFKDFYMSYFTDINCISDRKSVADILKDKISLLRNMQ